MYRLPSMQQHLRSQNAAVRLLQPSEVQPAVYWERNTVDERRPH